MTHDLNATIKSSFGYYLEDFRSRVITLSKSIPEEQFWVRPYPYGNSIGNLVLHLNGNLAYYIGAIIEDSGYQRDRENEFSRQQTRSRESALHEFSLTVDEVLKSLERQSISDWSTEYIAEGVDDVHDRFSIFLRCSVHFHHHIGQMIYLAKAINGDTND